MVCQELELVFVAVWLSVAQVGYGKRFVEVVKNEFVEMFREECKEWKDEFKGFEARYEMIVKKFEQEEMMMKKEEKKPRAFEEVWENKSVR